MNKKYTGVDFRIISMLGIFCFAFLVQTAAQDTGNNYKIRTVVIDAGHGGKDPGSIGKQTSEKHVVLAIALKLGEYIEQNIPDVKVVYTRKKDEFVPLHKRAEIANSHKADLFISIHANGNSDHKAYGTETLLLGYHRAGENFEVAKQENSVILYEEDYTTTYEGFDPNSPESYIMFSLMQERYFERSVSFAALVQDQFRERAKRKDRGVYRQGLLVLARTAMPGVLIETGFITNPGEEDYLISEHGQDLIASAIFRAFRDYRNVVESKSYFATTSKTMDLILPDEPENVVLKDPDIQNSNEDPGPVEAAPGNALTPIEFKIQVTVSSKSIPLNAPLFEGLKEVSEYQVDGLFKYAVGGSHTFEEIMAYSNKIRERFPDAFIIGIKDGAIIPLSQALSESQQNIRKN
ncbi:MAG: N-acetylmuramoyl-L-alanine amidase [Bacteroidales bacterium]|nr:N-acetylmuramoyl-L-alanine amidase [Bacteroidales bacterium]